MRILFVTHYFHPEPNFFMGLPFARELASRGHEVEVLTGFPNYPGGMLYSGYKQKLVFREVIDGIPVVRVPLYPSHDKSSLKRMACYITHALSAASIGVATVKHADIAYIMQGPASIGLPACMLKAVRGIPFVLHIFDLWPDTLEATGMFKNRTGLWLAQKWCNSIYSQAGKIVLCSAGYKQKLLECGVPEEKTHTIYNWCDEGHITPIEPDQKLAEELGMKGKFNVVYAGNFGAAQSLGSIISAAQLIQSQTPLIQFVFIGTGLEEEELKFKTVALQLRNVRFLPRMPASEISKVLSLADIVLSHLKDEHLFQLTIPGKIPAYLASGKPILVAIRGSASDLVMKANAGFACEPENPADIAATIMRFLSLAPEQLKKMGENGRRFYEQELCMSVAADKIEKIFQSAIGAH